MPPTTPPIIVDERSNGMIVGIDLGTTNSLVAVMQAGKPILLPNRLGQTLTPSAVSVDENATVLVGAPALARRTTHPLSTATAFKRDMGTTREYQLGKLSFTPQQLSAFVLRSLKQDAESALGIPVTEVVVTVPAYFDESQRRATRDAAEIAGLRAERIINEPTAAAMAYGIHERHREFKAAVIDLGGGTFDVTILEIMEGVIEIQSTAGDSRLGGEDFVAALTEYVADQSGLTGLQSEPILWARLQVAVEQTKRRLSSVPSDRVVLSNFPGPGQSFERIVTRAEAETVFAGLVSRMRTPILRALRDARLRPEDVDEVLLVGGATRMPLVANLATEIFGRLPSRELPPDEAIALGAAVQGALKARDKAVDDVVVTDVAPFSMGIATASETGRRMLHGIFSPIIERGTVIPVSREQSFSTISDRQKVLAIEVYQGEHSLCRDNKKLGAFNVTDLPPRPAGECEVRVRFTYDLNGLLEVEATVADTGAKKSIVLEQTPGRLSEKEIAQARQRMAELKFDPRDSLPNKTTLARAEALHVELTGDARDMLRDYLLRFRAAIESQSTPDIDAAREELNAFMAALSRPRDGLN